MRFLIKNLSPQCQSRFVRALHAGYGSGAGAGTEAGPEAEAGAGADCYTGMHGENCVWCWRLYA